MEHDPIGTPIYTAAELAAAIDAALKETFPDTIMVQGEVSNLRRSAKGHVYFNLLEPTDAGKQTQASLPVALFQSNKATVNLLLRRAGVGRIEDGMPVRIRTMVDFFAPRGTLTLTMSGIDPTFTLDFLASKRKRLLAELLEEGLDKPNAALPMPTVPHRIGLVSSVGSAAYADFTDELSRSELNWDLVVADSRVQGEAAETGLIAGLKALAEYDVGLVALVRGGGSQGDLTTFDSELLARAIASSPVPIITGIGHEIDTSIADVMAHSSFKTPTACAAFLVQAAKDSHQTAEQTWDKILFTSQSALDQTQDKLNNQTRLWAVRATQSTQQQDQKVKRLEHSIPDRANKQLNAATESTDRLNTAVERSAKRATGSGAAHLATLENRFNRHSHRTLDHALKNLETVASRIRSLDPKRNLERGWSITATADGKPLRSISQTKAGDRLQTTLSDGTINSVVE